MGKRMRGLRYAAAVVAMLHACLIVHAVHPWLHPETAGSQTCTCPTSSVGGNPACSCRSGPVFVAGHGGMQASGQCAICQFLMHLQSRDVGSTASVVTLDAAPEQAIELTQVVYASPSYVPANARAPPAVLSLVTLA
jgi:hypothetical protein